jgi:hypothetical protein
MGVIDSRGRRLLSGLERHQRRRRRPRSPRPLHRPGPARSLRSLASAELTAALLGLRPAVLAGSGTGAAASPFDSARTARGSVGAVSLVPPQPLAVLATLRASALARLETPGGRQVSGRHEVARSGPAAGRQRAPGGLTGEYAPGERMDRPAGSTDRKRAGASAVEAASEASVPEHPGARAGRCGGPLTRWNHHARTLDRIADPWRTSEGRGRSAVPGRRKHRSDRRERGAQRVPAVSAYGANKGSRSPRSEASRNVCPYPERPRASVAFPSQSYTPILQHNIGYFEQKSKTTTEVNT